MSWEQFLAWALPGSITVLIAVSGFIARKLWARLDAQDESNKEIKQMLATELRGLDVRLSVVEHQLGLRGK